MWNGHGRPSIQGDPSSGLPSNGGRQGLVTVQCAGRARLPPGPLSRTPRSVPGEVRPFLALSAAADSSCVAVSPTDRDTEELSALSVRGGGVRHPPAPPVSWVSPLSLSAAKQLQSQDPNSRGKWSLLHSELQASPSQPEPARASPSSYVGGSSPPSNEQKRGRAVLTAQQDCGQNTWHSPRAVMMGGVTLSLWGH